MCRRCVCLVAVVGLLQQSAQASDVYFVLGQSNGWRIGHIGDFPDGPGHGPVTYFPMDCGSRPVEAKLQVIQKIHPSTYGAGLAEALLEQSEEGVILVQYCVCGTSLRDTINWNPGEDPASGRVNNEGLFGSFLKYAADARRQAEAAGHTWNVKGVFWHQGESDADAHADDYEGHFRRLVVRLREELGVDVPIVAGQIREQSDGSREVNRALKAVAADDPRVIAVSTDGLTYESPTDVHFNPDGCHEMGRRMAKAYADLRKESRRR